MTRWSDDMRVRARIHKPKWWQKLFGMEPKIVMQVEDVHFGPRPLGDNGYFWRDARPGDYLHTREWPSIPRGYP